MRIPKLPAVNYPLETAPLMGLGWVPRAPSITLKPFMIRPPKLLIVMYFPTSRFNLIEIMKQFDVTLLNMMY